MGPAEKTDPRVPSGGSRSKGAKREEPIRDGGVEGANLRGREEGADPKERSRVGWAKAPSRGGRAEGGRSEGPNVGFRSKGGRVEGANLALAVSCSVLASQVSLVCWVVGHTYISKQTGKQAWTQIS